MSAPEWHEALSKDVARCAKKHKAAASAAADGVDRVLEALAQARAGGGAEQDGAAVAQLRARLAEVGEASAAAAADTAKELTAVVGKLGKARASARCTREHASSRNARPVAFRSTLTALRLCRHARRLTSTFRSTWRAPGGSGPSTKARCSRCVP